MQKSNKKPTEEAKDCNLSPNTMQYNRHSLLCVNIGQYRAEEPQ